MSTTPDTGKHHSWKTGKDADKMLLADGLSPLLHCEKDSTLAIWPRWWKILLTWSHEPFGYQFIFHTHPSLCRLEIHNEVFNWHISKLFSLHFSEEGRTCIRTFTNISFLFHLTFMVGSPPRNFGMPSIVFWKIQGFLLPSFSQTHNSTNSAMCHLQLHYGGLLSGPQKAYEI